MSALLPSEVLAKAADLIEPEGAWTQGSYARGKSGAPVMPEGRHAVCWCAIGAIRRVGKRRDVQVRAIKRLELHVRSHVPTFNDDEDTTPAQVVAALRAASALAAEEGQ